MNTKKVQIIIGIIVVVIIIIAASGSLRQKADKKELVPAADTFTSTSTEQSVSAYIQTSNVVITDGTSTETIKMAAISAVTAQNISPANVIVSWVTSAPVMTEIYFSPTPPAPNTVRQLIRDAKQKTTHAVELTSLAPDTTYYYTILSVNSKEKIATSTVQGLFKTLKNN